MKELVQTDRAHRGLGPYSQAIRANGFLFVSGQLALDPATGEIIGEDIRAQVRQVLQNAGAILEAGGSSWKDVVKTTVFLRNMDDFAAMNEVYTTAMVDVPPARSAVEVGRLPRNALIELDVIALAPEPING
jgi:2-iminobutanoate/2-iminopropanoate deaminase